MKINNEDFPREAPINIRVPVIYQTLWYKLLVKLRIKPLSRDFAVYKLTLSTCAEISKLLLQIDAKDITTDSKLLHANYDLIVQHKQKLALIVALAVVNRKKRPGSRLTKFFLNNLSMNDLFIAQQVVQKQMDMKSFMKALVAVRGLDILSLQTN